MALVDGSINMDAAILAGRIRRLRMARGLTLDGLASSLGGIVTKQAISKYEQGKDVPSARVLTRLAAALGVKSVELWREPEVDIELVAYRKRSGLSKKDRTHIESRIYESLERRVRLQELTNQHANSDLPIKALVVK